MRDCNLLTNWLYGVALKVANKDRAKVLRRRVVERRAAEATTSPHGQPDQAELRSVIDEEIRRLPERYRVPLVLCHVEGLRHHEVAHRLGCPVGTVESRLSRAREQLRTRLARRGLAPTAPALGIVLRPPGASAITPTLLETTLRAAGEVSHQRATVGTGIVSLWSSMKLIFGQIPTFKHAVVASTLVVSVGLAVLGLTVYRADGESTTPTIADSPPGPTAPQETGRANARSRQQDDARTRNVSASVRPLAKNTPEQAKAIAVARFPSAVARPLTDITIDGRLDDWPEELTRYPIDNQLLDHPSYNSNSLTADEDPQAYFMAGYDPAAEQIYLAVAVHDSDVVVHPATFCKRTPWRFTSTATFPARASPRLRLKIGAIHSMPQPCPSFSMRACLVRSQPMATGGMPIRRSCTHEPGKQPRP